MPIIKLPSGHDLFYTVDDFTDPWAQAETVIFLHGLAEKGEAWRAWVPHFARDYRVVRPDQRGFGASTPMPEEFDWSMDVFADDLAHLASQLDLQRFHLVSAKLGGTIAIRFAAKYPQLVKSLSIVSAPVSLRQSLGSIIPGWVSQIREQGMRSWAASTMGSRLGSEMPVAGQEAWTTMMGESPPSSMLGIMAILADVDVTSDLEVLRCPVLVITTTGSLLGSVDAVRTWQQRIAGSELAVVDSDSYHVAAAKPDACAQKVLAFVRKHSDS